MNKAGVRKSFENPEYLEAVGVFYKRYLCTVEPWPCPEVQVTQLSMQQCAMTSYRHLSVNLLMLSQGRSVRIDPHRFVERLERTRSTQEHHCTHVGLQRVGR